MREREKDHLWQKSVAAICVEVLRGTHDFLT